MLVTKGGAIEVCGYGHESKGHDVSPVMARRRITDGGWYIQYKLPTRPDPLLDLISPRRPTRILIPKFQLKDTATHGNAIDSYDCTPRMRHSCILPTSAREYD